MEMILKTAGIITILISLSTISSTLQLSLLRIVELCIFSPLLLGFCVLLLSSLSSKEIFSVLFTIVSFAAHLSLIPLLLFGNPGFSLALFCSLMCVGEAYRLVFSTSADVKINVDEEKDDKRRRLIVGFVFMFVIVYVVVLALESMTLIQINRGI
jgi:hypothetical protein